jgi:Uma2 family endonuclease
VTVAFPKRKRRHNDIQHNVYELLKPLAGDGILRIEFAFRPLPEHEFWAADVAFISRERWIASDPDDNLSGSPELAIEILSPSNTASEMLERKQMFLSTGSVEFWVVDPERRVVEVSSRSGRVRFYGPGESIASEVFPGAAIPVDPISSSSRPLTGSSRTACNPNRCAPI